MPERRYNQSDSGRSTLVTAAGLVTAVLVVFATISSYSVSAKIAGQYSDAYGVARAELRFAPLLARVPAEAQLAYITDLDPSHNAYAPAFLAAQFALAPRQLLLPSRGARPEWAVGNFSEPRDYAAAGARWGYEVTADLGNGVILYRRKHSS